MKTLARRFAIFLLIAPSLLAQERRVYEGVVEVKKETIGTVALLDIHGASVGGWLRMEKFVPIDGGTVSEGFVEFQAAGNSYKIDERKGRISYSGPDGSGSRFIAPLTRLAGRLEEITEGERFSGINIAKMDVQGRPRSIRYGSPSLWKRQGPPFEKFSRLEDFLGKEISLWIGDMDARSGRLVIVEEPEGMNVSLKLSKEEQKLRDQQKKEQQEKDQQKKDQEKKSGQSSPPSKR